VLSGPGSSSTVRRLELAIPHPDAIGRLLPNGIPRDENVLLWLLVLPWIPAVSDGFAVGNELDSYRPLAVRNVDWVIAIEDLSARGHGSLKGQAGPRNLTLWVREKRIATEPSIVWREGDLQFGWRHDSCRRGSWRSCRTGCRCRRRAGRSRRVLGGCRGLSRRAIRNLALPAGSRDECKAKVS